MAVLNIINELSDLVNPSSLLQYGGLTLLLIIVFAENGLPVGFFLPGDSLIFVSGMICSTEPEILNVPIMLLVILMILAAISGSAAGYYFGYKVGPPIFNREDSVLFNKKYIEMTQNFYLKHGGKTLILGRFLPIIRTFAPILAGVIKVDLKNFFFFNTLGALIWVTPLSLAGYFLGTEFPQVRDYLEYIIGGFIVITTAILIRTYIQEKKKLKKP